MLEYLIQLPCEALGQNVLGFLEFIDIIQFERAATSYKSQQLLKSILLFCPTIKIPSTSVLSYFNKDICNWVITRRCRVKELNIDIKTLCEVEIHHSVITEIGLCCMQNISLSDVNAMDAISSKQLLSRLKIRGKQDPVVMEVLFTLLSNSSSVRSLDIQESNLYQWINHINKIGPCLKELSLRGVASHLTLSMINEHCPYLEKLKLFTDISQSSSCVLQNIARNCPHLSNLKIILRYSLTVEADADLTAFAEKCPQLEELSLTCHQLTDQSVIALAQHCSRLKKLHLHWCAFTVDSLIALSERGLTLEELDIPPILIPSAEIAAQCAQALSRIRKHHTYSFEGTLRNLHYKLQYMTGLRELDLNNSEDHLLVPHLLLQGQCCAGLESLSIGSNSSITPQQLCNILKGCMQLRTILIHHCSCTSDAVLVELARSCPHLQKVTLWSSGVTEEGVMALAAHCRQLQELDLPKITLSKESVRQLAQHCRHLTSVIHKNEWSEYNEEWSSGEIREMRELMPL